MAGRASIKEVRAQTADIQIIVEPTEVFQGHPVDIQKQLQTLQDRSSIEDRGSSMLTLTKTPRHLA